MALLQQNPAGNAFLDKLWLIPAISVWDATSGEASRGYRLDERAEARGFYEPKNRAVSSGEVIQILRTQHLPVELAAEADLATVTAEAFRLTLPQDETGRPDVTLDYGDVLLLRAALAASDGSCVTTMTVVPSRCTRSSNVGPTKKPLTGMALPRYAISAPEAGAAGALPPARG